MPITGEIVVRAGDRTKRAEAAAAKASVRTEEMKRDAVRQRMWAIQALRSKVSTAEQEVAKLKREAADIEATITEARETAAATGHRDPNLYRLTFEAAEMPNMIAGADARLNTVRNELADALDREAEHERQARARAAAEVELDRLATERAAQLEALTAANLAAEPVPAKRRAGK